MLSLLTLPERIFAPLARHDTALLASLARFVFAAVLLVYFWASATSKLGEGMFGFLFPDVGAYVQIFPKQMELVNYDTSQLGVFHWLVVLIGTWAEFILPFLLVIGLFTRLAALGMIGFIAVQTATDLFGHNLINDPTTIGALFDRIPDSAITDQRLLWFFVLLVIVIKGAGPLSLDFWLLKKQRQES